MNYIKFMYNTRIKKVERSLYVKLTSTQVRLHGEKIERYIIPIVNKLYNFNTRESLFDFIIDKNKNINEFNELIDILVSRKVLVEVGDKRLKKDVYMSESIRLSGYKEYNIVILSKILSSNIIDFLNDLFLAGSLKLTLIIEHNECFINEFNNKLLKSINVKILKDGEIPDLKSYSPDFVLSLCKTIQDEYHTHLTDFCENQNCKGLLVTLNERCSIIGPFLYGDKLPDLNGATNDLNILIDKYELSQATEIPISLILITLGIVSEEIRKGLLLEAGIDTPFCTESIYIFDIELYSFTRYRLNYL